MGEGCVQVLSRMSLSCWLSPHTSIRTYSIEMRSQLPLAFRSALSRSFFRSISFTWQVVRSFSSSDCRWMPKELPCAEWKYSSGCLGAAKKWRCVAQRTESGLAEQWPSNWAMSSVELLALQGVLAA